MKKTCFYILLAIVISILFVLNLHSTYIYHQDQTLLSKFSSKVNSFEKKNQHQLDYIFNSLMENCFTKECDDENVSQQMKTFTDYQFIGAKEIDFIRFSKAKNEVQELYFNGKVGASSADSQDNPQITTVVSLLRGDTDTPIIWYYEFSSITGKRLVFPYKINGVTVGALVLRL